MISMFVIRWIVLLAVLIGWLGYFLSVKDFALASSTLASKPRVFFLFIFFARSLYSCSFTILGVPSIQIGWPMRCGCHIHVSASSRHLRCHQQFALVVFQLGQRAGESRQRTLPRRAGYFRSRGRNASRLWAVRRWRWRRSNLSLLGCHLTADCAEVAIVVCRRDKWSNYLPGLLNFNRRPAV